MNTRPILFRADMVRALLDGRKTQTRRVVKPQPNSGPDGEMVSLGADEWALADGCLSGLWRCPYGQPGDLLWVREAWVELLAVSPATDQPIEITDGERLIVPPTSWIDDEGRTRWHYNGRVIAYRANSDIEFCDGDGFSSLDFADKDDMPRWRPSIHMPRWASRLTLRITEVRVERVQDMEGQHHTESDAIAEGVRAIHHGDGAYYYSAFRDEPHPENWCDPTDAFRELWDTMRAGTDYAWDRNPWVWVIGFEVIRANVDEVLEEADRG